MWHPLGWEVRAFLFAIRKISKSCPRKIAAKGGEARKWVADQELAAGDAE